MTGVPLGLKPRVNVAWPGRPPVPGILHAEFIQKLGIDHEEAERELRAWYPVVAAAYAGRPIGEDDFTFWRARFREWVGSTTVAPPSQRKLGPSYTPGDWWLSCHHEPKCDTGPMHRMREGIDAAKRGAE